MIGSSRMGMGLGLAAMAALAGAASADMGYRHERTPDPEQPEFYGRRQYVGDRKQKTKKAKSKAAVKMSAQKKARKVNRRTRK